ncbi:MAG TPA: hypothetical protein VN549_01490 [Negativicutes bacterium]|nr:hypothetical protein [Negativicutes bacterium]
MAVLFFYISAAAVWAALLVVTIKRPPALRHLMVAIAAIGYSLLFETSLGEYAGLYYYIDKENSLFYIILAAVLLYPVIDVIYTLFLPERAYPAIIYTAVWTACMLVFELTSFYTRTVVLTGWRVFPWSIITYIITFAWINLLFRSLKKRDL